MTIKLFDLPQPEIMLDNFEGAWRCVHLVAYVMEWNKQKRIAVLPALLRGRFVDQFLEVGEEDKTKLTN